MAERLTLAQALIHWKAVAADELIGRLASFRRAVAAVPDDVPSSDTAAAGVTAAGLDDALEAALDPAGALEAALDPAGTLGAALDPAGSAAGLGVDSPPAADPAAAAVDAPASQPAADAAQMQTDLLREQIEISRSLLDLAQGSGIKVNGPDPSWGP